MTRALLGPILRAGLLAGGVALSALSVVLSPQASAGGRHKGPPVESAAAFNFGLESAVFDCATEAYAAGVAPEGSWRVSYGFARHLEVVRSAATGSVSTQRRIYLETTTVDAEPGAASQFGECLRLDREYRFPTDGFSYEPYSAHFSIDASVTFAPATCSPDGQARSIRRIAFADGSVEEDALALGDCTPAMWARACEAAGSHPEDPESQDWRDATLSQPPIVPTGVAECDALRDRYVAGIWAGAEAAARMGQLPTLDSILSGFLHPMIAPIISSVRWSETEHVGDFERAEITRRLREHGTECYFESLYSADPGPTIRGRIVLQVSATGSGAWTVNWDLGEPSALAACLGPHLAGKWNTTERMVNATVVFAGLLPDDGDFAEAMALRKVLTIRLAAEQDPVGAYATLMAAASEANPRTHERAVAAVLAEQVLALPKYHEAVEYAETAAAEAAEYAETAAAEAVAFGKAEKAFYADKGLTDAFGGERVAQLLVTHSACGPANRQFKAVTCDARIDTLFRARWCAQDWNLAVEAGGREAALAVLDSFCGWAETHNAPTWTRPGTAVARLVDYSSEICVAEIRSWCR